MRKIIDDQSENNGRMRLSVPAVYDSIKRSNSSLNRKPKKLLEDSIERVLEVVKSDVLGGDDQDSIDGDFDGLEEEKPVPVCAAILCSSKVYLQPNTDRTRNQMASIGVSSACGRQLPNPFPPPRKQPSPTV